MQKNVHLEKTHVNWVSVVGTGNEYPILSLIRFSPYMLPAGHERRVWAWNKSFQSLPKLSDRLAFQAPILSTGLKTSFKNYWQIIFTKSSKCLQNWSMLVNLNPNLDDVYHHPTQDLWNIKWSSFITHFFRTSAIRINDWWSTTMIIHDLPYGTTWGSLYGTHFFTDHPCIVKSVPFFRRQGSIPWYQEFPQVPRSIRAIDPGVMGESMVNNKNG